MPISDHHTAQGLHGTRFWKRPAAALAALPARSRQSAPPPRARSRRGLILGHPERQDEQLAKPSERLTAAGTKLHSDSTAPKPRCRRPEPLLRRAWRRHKSCEPPSVVASLAVHEQRRAPVAPPRPQAVPNASTPNRQVKRRGTLPLCWRCAIRADRMATGQRHTQRCVMLPAALHALR